MTIFVSRANLLVVTVPKCGCTSIKRFMHALNTGEKYGAMKGNHIHQMYKTLSQVKIDKAFSKDIPRVTVIRHPVDRILSCYFEKVVRLSSDESLKPSLNSVKSAGLNLNPTALEFVENISEYQRASRMLHQHSRPLEFFLGNSPERFERVFDISEMTNLAEMVNEKAGTKVNLRRSNKTKVSYEVDELSKVVDRIMDDFSSDMEIYGKWIKTSKWVPETLPA